MKYPIYNGYVTSPFGIRQRNGKEEMHEGIDITCKEITPLINAPCRMQVHVAGYSETFGNRVWCKLFDGEHAGKYIVFAHMLKISDSIVQNKELSCGDFIGWMGSTGLSTAPHLHMEIRDKPILGAQSYDPVNYII